MAECEPPLKIVCLENCSSKWCCSVKYFPPPPLCLHEIARIRLLIGHSGFYEKNGSQYVLKIKKSGYCFFFYEQKKTCKIYNNRPSDCRIFPLDSFAHNQRKGVWLIWDCFYSRLLNELHIEKNLDYLEKRYEKEIIETWNYANIINPNNPNGFRLLREMQIAPFSSLPFKLDKPHPLIP